MIFVTVGTVKGDELIRKVDEIAKDSKKEFILQIGREGGYIPKNCKWFRIKVPLTKYFKNSKLVITHGGAGTLFELLNMGVRIIAVPNLKAKSAHQVDLVSELAKEGYIIASDLKGLKKAIDEKKKFKKYIRPKCRIGKVIKSFLSETSI